MSASVLYSSYSCFERLFSSKLQFVFEMKVRRCYKEMCVLYAARNNRIDIARVHAGKSAHLRGQPKLVDSLNRSKLPFGDDWKTGFDHVNPQTVERFCDFHLVVNCERNSGGLLPVAERRIENPNSPLFRTHIHSPLLSPVRPVLTTSVTTPDFEASPIKLSIRSGVEQNSTTSELCVVSTVLAPSAFERSMMAFLPLVLFVSNFTRASSRTTVSAWLKTPTSITSIIFRSCFTKSSSAASSPAGTIVILARSGDAVRPIEMLVMLKPFARNIPEIL